MVSKAAWRITLLGVFGTIMPKHWAGRVDVRSYGHNGQALVARFPAILEYYLLSAMSGPLDIDIRSHPEDSIGEDLEHFSTNGAMEKD